MAWQATHLPQGNVPKVTHIVPAARENVFQERVVLCMFLGWFEGVFDWLNRVLGTFLGGLKVFLTPCFLKSFDNRL